MIRTDRRSISSKVKSSVIAECANHLSIGPCGVKNHCWLQEKNGRDECVFFGSDIEPPKCPWFEQTVLPADKDLKAVFSDELLATQIREARKGIRKKCRRPGCEEIFLAQSNRQEFCPRCQKAAYRDKSRAWDQANRKTASMMSQSAI